jgi:hypothetical protein
MRIDRNLILDCYKNNKNISTIDYDVVCEKSEVEHILKNHNCFSSKVFSIFYSEEKPIKFPPFEIEGSEHLLLKKQLLKQFKNIDYKSYFFDIINNINLNTNKIEEVIFNSPFKIMESLLSIENLDRKRFYKIIKNQLYGCVNYDFNYAKAIALLKHSDVNKKYANNYELLYTLLLAGIESIITSVKFTLAYCLKHNLKQISKENCYEIISDASPIVVCRSANHDIGPYIKNKKIILITKSNPFGLGVHKCPGDVLGLFQVITITNFLLDKIKSIKNTNTEVGQIISYNNYEIEWK